MRAVLVGTLALFLLLPAANAQAPQPPACPRPEFQTFLPLLGNWTVQWTDRIAPGKYADVKGSARMERDPTGVSWWSTLLVSAAAAPLPPCPC